MLPVVPLLPGVVDAGAVHYGAGHSAFYDAWREGHSLVLRLGRMEVVADLQG